MLQYVSANMVVRELDPKISDESPNIKFSTQASSTIVYNIISYKA